MFRIRQLSRIAFGLVLLAGAVWLVASFPLENSRGHASADLLAKIWGMAMIAALATRVIASLLPAKPSTERLLSASLTIPAAGLTLVLPLTLHALWFRYVSDGLSGFDGWVWWCMVCTGPAHLAFLGSTVVRARQLAHGKDPVPVASIYASSVVMGSLPFPVLPSLVIAFTGIPIAPLLWLMKPLARRERAALTTLPTALLRRG